MKRFHPLAALIVAAILVSPVVGQDAKPEKKGKGKGRRANAGAQVIKQLEAVGLTEDQKAKITELGKALAEKRTKMLADAGVTPELIKKRQEAMASMKDSGKKGKELAAAVNEKAGLSKEQAAVMVKANQMRQELMKAVVAMLSDDQKAKLPKNLARQGKGGGKKPAKKPAKKKAAEKAAE